MTKQETEELVTCWMRIWEGDSPFVYATKYRHAVVGAIYKKRNIEITLGVGSALLAEIDHQGSMLACLCHDQGRGEVYSPPNSAPNGYTAEQNQSFIAKWTPFFRRGCFLSGCPVDASMHEKVEWMQGFTKEEIESWKRCK